MFAFSNLSRLFVKDKSHSQEIEELNHSSLEEMKPVENTTLTLFEQLQMIDIVDRYLEEFQEGKVRVDPGWEKGFYIECETMMTQDQQVLRSNMEVFYQKPESSVKECSFLVNLVKFPEDSWRILQVKHLNEL